MFHRANGIGYWVVVALFAMGLGAAEPAGAQEVFVDAKVPTLVATGPGQGSYFFVFEGKRQWLPASCTSLVDDDHIPVRVQWRSISGLQSAPTGWSCDEIADLLAGGGAADYVLVTNSANNVAGWLLSPTSKQWLSANCRLDLESMGYTFDVVPYESFGNRARAVPEVACADIASLVQGDASPVYPARCVLVSTISRAECEALVALYYSTGGPGWTDQGRWLEGDDPCTWNRLVELSGGGIDGSEFRHEGVFCDGGAVVGVVMSVENNLMGQLPQQLGDLTGLNYLNLDGQGLTGAIPASIGNLNNLEGLWLFGNQLSGTLPSTMAGMDSLRWLYLDGSCVGDADPTISSWLATLEGYLPGVNC